MSPWAASWWVVVGTPLAGIAGHLWISTIHSAVSGANQSRLRQASCDRRTAGETASVVIGGTPCEPRASCLRSGIGCEQAERQKWTEWDVLVVHKILFGQG